MSDRDAREDPPRILIPFPDRTEPVNSEPKPGPVLEFHGYYIFNDVPVHLVGERWKAEHAEHIPSYSCPDPMQPGILLTSRLENAVDGSLIRAVSYEEFQARLREIRAGYEPRRAETYRLR